MSVIKLFEIKDGAVTELEGEAVAVEKSLQNLIESHLEDFLGIRFLGSEYATGKAHGGRIDTLGIDEDGGPVIIEYKRHMSQNVINQGLFYLDWLLDHKGEFTLVVMKRFGAQAAEPIDWTIPRLVCIAGDFTKYDEYAIKQMDRNIDLVRYRRYGDRLLLFERVNAVQAGEPPEGNGGTGGGGKEDLHSRGVKPPDRFVEPVKGESTLIPFHRHPSEDADTCRVNPG